MQSLVPIQLADHISPFQRGLDGHRGRESEVLWRSDKWRTRDRETKRDRDRKYSDDEDDDAYFRHEAERRRKAAEERLRDEELRERGRAKVERERERERGLRGERGRDQDDYEPERRLLPRYKYNTHYYAQLEDDVMTYQGRDKRRYPQTDISRGPLDVFSSEFEHNVVDGMAEDHRLSGRPTPVFVRRGSAKPAAPSPQPRRDRDRNMSVPDIPESDARRPTMLYTSASSPSSIKLPRGVERGPPLRSASMMVDSDIIVVPPSRTTSRHNAAPQVYPIRSNLIYDDSNTRPSAARDTLRNSSVSAISNHDANLDFGQYSNANRDTVLNGFPSLTKEANRYLNDTISADHTRGHGKVTKMKLCALSTRL